MVQGRIHEAFAPTAMLRRARLFLKTIAVVVTVAFLGLTLQPLALATHLPAHQAPAPKALSDEERLSKTLESIETRLERLDQKLAKKASHDQERNELTAHRSELDDLDRKALQHFNDIEKHLKDKNLPQVILNRHAQALRHYQTEMATLKANLDALDQATDDNDRRTKTQKAKDHLKAKQKKRVHTPFDPKAAPALQPKFKERAPRTNKQQFSALESPVRLASAGSVAGLLLSAALLVPPTPEDLAETPEVQFSPDVQRLATLFEKYSGYSIKRRKY